MSRYDNENVRSLELPEVDEIKIDFINAAGNLGVQDKAVAKITTVHNKEEDKISINYYIKCGRGMLFDPHGIDANKINSYNFQFKKVDKSIYDQYVQYLKTRRSMFLTYAQREFKDKGY